MGMDQYSTFQNKKVLITGGLGFIGSHLARALVNLNNEVTLVDSLIPEYGGCLFNIHDIKDKVKVNISDIRDVYSLSYLVKGKDYLFNLAGQTSHIDSMEDPYTDLEINCKAQLSLLETCRKYNPSVKIVYASTRQIYGKPDYVPVDEKHLLRPVDVNGINKMAAEWYHILYNNVYGIRSCALRLINTYGPGMRIKDTRQTFLGIWFKLLIQNKPFEVWGGDQLRDYNYVDDVVSALIFSALNPKANGKVFNLGGNNFYSLKETAKLLIKVNKGGSFIIKRFPSDRKKIDIGDFYSDFSYIKSQLGWAPQFSLENGFKRTIQYFRKYLNHYL